MGVDVADRGAGRLQGIQPCSIQRRAEALFPQHTLPSAISVS